MPKDAIYDNRDVLQYLNNARCQRDQVIGFLFVNFGMHCQNVHDLGPKNITVGQEYAVLEFSRVKTGALRSELISKPQALIILKWIKAKKNNLKLSNRMYEYICEDMGEFLTDGDKKRYLTGKVSPSSLRHTYVLNRLREYWDDTDKLDLVAAKAGCHKKTVLRHYLKLKDWIKVGKDPDKRPLDLSNFEFMA